MNYMPFTRDTAIAEAVDRDVGDRIRLERIHTLVTNALDAMANEAHDLRHPDCKWQPDDLIELLLDQAKSIKWELDRVTRGPVVLGDWA